MVAAIKPARTDFLYFVSQNNGHTVFSNDYASHNKAVGKYQVDPKARQGKLARFEKEEKVAENITRNTL